MFLNRQGPYQKENHKSELELKVEELEQKLEQADMQLGTLRVFWIHTHESCILPVMLVHLRQWPRSLGFSLGSAADWHAPIAGAEGCVG